MASRAAPRSAQPAYVLHHHDWSESSLILDLFTREQGRIAVVAKGAKRPYSQLRSVLLPFQRLNVVAGSGKRGDDSAEIHTLRTAEWAGGGAMLGGAALLSGFYLNELLLKGLARHDPHPRLFDAYALTLVELGRDDDAGTQVALRAFELWLLRELGVLPQLDLATLTQQPVTSATRYLLSPDTGVLRSPDEADALAGATLAALQAALDAHDLTALRQATRPALGPLRQQLRGLLHHLFGTDRLRTRQVMLDLQRLSAATLPSVPPAPTAP
ncbi:MAG: DNA repair protein RecO [Burkholderiales bacterium]